LVHIRLPIVALQGCVCVLDVGFENNGITFLLEGQLGPGWFFLLIACDFDYWGVKWNRVLGIVERNWVDLAGTAWIQWIVDLLAWFLGTRPDPSQCLWLFTPPLGLSSFSLIASHCQACPQRAMCIMDMWSDFCNNTHGITHRPISSRQLA
jgi:hypothetical protein